MSLRKPWSIGTKVRIRIVHKGTNFAALGRVANSQPDVGMGVVFTQIEPNAQVVLDEWVRAAETLRSAIPLALR